LCGIGSLSKETRAYRHPREGGDPVLLFNMPLDFVLAAQENLLFCWIPACAGMMVLLDFLS
jgi:hypothetical protein